ncbi:MAG: hydantoinase/oxoprolinase family protein, partial [Candidatus Rokubacteria bacterium]|nr:hydantoinase/oxoprolinase family protein [Candidatus Rokubacteria bacterium]
TVTDADLLLGYLSPDYFLGGELRLDRRAAERAVGEHVARALGTGVPEAAVGIHGVVNENMAAAARMHVAEKGRDPRRYTLIAFGGAGPVHAWGLAKLLKLRRIIYPFGAGVTSALGFLVAAPAIDYVRSYVARLERAEWGHVNGLFAEMEAEARGLLLESGASPAEIALHRTADMRYVGQGFEVPVPLPPGPLDADRLRDIQEAFFRSYRERFARHVSDVPVEAVSWRLGATGPVPNVRLEFAGQPAAPHDAGRGARPVYFPETGLAACPVYSRYALRSGTALRGPAIIEERESTIVVGPDGRASVDEHLNVVVELG